VDRSTVVDEFEADAAARTRRASGRRVTPSSPHVSGAATLRHR
jgi:hypothetical protein